MRVAGFFALAATVALAFAGVASAQRTTPIAPGDSASCATRFVPDGVDPQHRKHCATLTPTPTRTATATPSGHPNTCHAPTTHEHGDCAPQWVQGFIAEQCAAGNTIPFDCAVGQPIYGGNERSSPAENAMKHEAFKGVILQTVAGGEVYWRYHAASNPSDRSAQFHSWEVYYRDAAGGVSFFEGHYDAGDPSDPQRRCAVPNQSCGGARPIIIMNGDRTEQWYMHHGLLSFGVNISGPTTYYGGLAENATAHDRSTWLLTGKLGTGREISTEVFISEAAARLVPGLHCANAHSGRGPCDAEHPMRYVMSPTLAHDLREEFGVQRISTVRMWRSYPCPACQVPN